MNLTSIIPADAKTAEEMQTMMLRKMAFVIDNLRQELRQADKENERLEYMLKCIQRKAETDTSDYFDGDVLRFSSIYPDDEGYQELLGYFAEAQK